jgi:hypothetical protein
MRFKLCMVALATVLGAANTARAGLSYSLSSTQSVTGTTDTVSIFLVETVTSPNTPYIGPGGSGGLFGAAFGINYVSGGNATITGVAQNAAFTANSNGSPTFANQVNTSGNAAAIYEAAPLQPRDNASRNGDE